MKDPTSSKTCVIVFLKPVMGLALAESWPVKKIVLGNDEYEPVGPEWSGFYDWLRDHNSKLLGIRYHPSDETKFVLERGRELSYAKVGDYEDLCLFLTGERTFDAVLSEDQDILYDQVFATNDGKLAICLAKNLIEPAELVALKNADATWLDAQKARVNKLGWGMPGASGPAAARWIAQMRPCGPPGRPPETRVTSSSGGGCWAPRRSLAQPDLLAQAPHEFRSVAGPIDPVENLHWLSSLVRGR